METSQERADRFAERLGGQVAKAIDALIGGANTPAKKLERALGQKADQRQDERARDERRLRDLAVEQSHDAAMQHGPDPAGRTAKTRDEVSLTHTPQKGKIRAGAGEGRR